MFAFPRFDIRTTSRALVLAGLLSAAIAPAHALTDATATSGFDSVGQIGSAGGVLIAGNWVLTAAHVARSVALGTSTFASELGASVIDAVYFYSDAAIPNHDIALVHLSSSILGTDTVLSDDIIRTRDLASLGPLTAVSAQNTTGDQARAAMSGSEVVNTRTEDGATQTVNWLVTQGSVVQGGDSGSALYLGAVTDSSQAVLTGIASSLLSEEGGQASSAYVQIARYQSWIDTTLAANGQHAVWASAVPEPSALALYLTGGLFGGGLALRRARKPGQHGTGAQTPACNTGRGEATSA